MAENKETRYVTLVFKYTETDVNTANITRFSTVLLDAVRSYNANYGGKKIGQNDSRICAAFDFWGMYVDDADVNASNDIEKNKNEN